MTDRPSANSAATDSAAADSAATDSAATDSAATASAAADDSRSVVDELEELIEAEPLDRFDEINRRLHELADLFTRRLADDRARRAAVEELTARLRQAEAGPFREILHPFVHGVALVIDRLDRYAGADPEFAASVRDELLDVLERHGVRKVPVDGEFDPSTQEAVEVRHDPDHPAGEILEVRRTGFAHGTWVFRPAHVVVNSDEPDDGANR